VNAKDKGGETPLHLASYNGHAEVATLLIEKGADVNAKKNDGQTPLHKARSAEIAMLLIEKWGVLHWASSVNNMDNVTAQITKGVDVNKKDRTGRTALQYASKEGHVEAVRALLDAGADITIRDNDAKTAAILAEEAGHKGIADLLRTEKPPVEDRLKTLKSLYDKSLITRSEYTDRKKVILDEL